MSYILDALRKSERDRRAGAIPSLDDLPLDSSDQPRNKPWVAILISVTICINLVTLLVVFVYNREPSTTSVVSTADQAIPSIDNSLGQNKFLAEETTNKQVVAQEIAPPLNGSEPKQKSRNHQVDLIPPTGTSTTSDTPSGPSIKTETKVEHRAQSKPLNTPIKKTISDPVTDHPTSSTSNSTAQKSLKPSQPQPVAVYSEAPSKPVRIKQSPPQLTIDKPRRNPRKPESSNTAKALPSATKKITGSSPRPPITQSAPPNQATPKPTVPLLRELPRDFQRQVPNLNINVFVYSDNVDERFVIINMVKYTNGQKVREGPIVGEIRSDSVVLKYQGRNFRLKRP